MSRNRLQIVVLVFFLLLPFSAGAVPLCFQQFNAYGPAYAPRLHERTEALMATLKDEEPCHLYQFQEVWTGKHIGWIREGIDLLDQSLNVQFLDDIRRDKLITGLLNMVQGQVLSLERIIYPLNKDGFLDDIRTLFGVAKAISISKLRLDVLPDEHPLLLVNTHTHPASQDVRLSQTLYLIESLIDRMPFSGPLILSGDLNAEPDSLEMLLLRDVLLLKDAYTSMNGPYVADACTYCRDNPLSMGGGDRVIDYVLYRSHPKLTLRPLDALINLKGDEAALSDHYGVRVFFDPVPEGSMPEPNPERFRKRILAALSSLESARDVLKTRNARKYRFSIAFAEKLMKRFQAESSDDPVIRYFKD